MQNLIQVDSRRHALASGEPASASLSEAKSHRSQWRVHRPELSASPHQGHQIPRPQRSGADEEFPCLIPGGLA